MLSKDVAQLYVPIVFTIGPGGAGGAAHALFDESDDHQDARRMEGGEHSADPSSCPGRGHPLIGWTRSARVGGSIRVKLGSLASTSAFPPTPFRLDRRSRPTNAPVLIDGTTCYARLRRGHSFLHLISGSNFRSRGGQDTGQP